MRCRPLDKERFFLRFLSKRPHRLKYKTILPGPRHFSVRVEKQSRSGEKIINQLASTTLGIDDKQSIGK
ncbi:hypothetical protein M0804_015245 [Polistes exclamans]|nr:hypothetical protein M0804_015245 [Polistes exclamans]